MVEDEPFIALDLTFAVEDAGGIVIGPAASAQEALTLLATRPVVAALLDFDLIDGDVSPVVEYLLRHGVPFILQTGVDLPPKIAERFPNLIVRIKPTMANRLVAELEMLLIPAGSQSKDRLLTPHI